MNDVDIAENMDPAKKVPTASMRLFDPDRFYAPENTKYHTHEWCNQCKYENDVQENQYRRKWRKYPYCTRQISDLI